MDAYLVTSTFLKKSLVRFEVRLDSSLTFKVWFGSSSKRCGSKVYLVLYIAKWSGHFLLLQNYVREQYLQTLEPSIPKMSNSVTLYIAMFVNHSRLLFVTKTKANDFF